MDLHSSLVLTTTCIYVAGKYKNSPYEDKIPKNNYRKLCGSDVDVEAGVVRPMYVHAKLSLAG